MRLHVLAVGTRMPAWVAAGFNDYAARMPAQCSLQLHEIPAAKRTAGADLQRVAADEGARLVARIPARAYPIALERNGRVVSTDDLAARLRGFLQNEPAVAFLIGGPEGLSKDAVAASRECWSLSALTLPHPLVRVLLAEQLYRAWSLINNLPYHRGD